MRGAASVRHLAAHDVSESDSVGEEAFETGGKHFAWQRSGPSKTSPQLIPDEEWFNRESIMSRTGY